MIYKFFLRGYVVEVKTYCRGVVRTVGSRVRTVVCACVAVDCILLSITGYAGR